MKQTITLPGSPARISRLVAGENLLGELPGALEAHAGKRTPYWIWDKRVWEIWNEKLGPLGWPGTNTGRVLLFGALEQRKRLSSVEQLAQQLVEAGADRRSVLVAVGGGVTGDVVGFLASIYMRGIPHYQIPTTLLAQVDSSIGGKTGVDLPEGKNLLGTFHQPDLIWMSPEFLETLAEEDFRQGMAEVIKTALIGDEVLWKYLETHAEQIKGRDREALLRIVSACCVIKAKVVEADEKESGYRRVLNLGHTVGHAVERLSDYRIPHGDAVAMGLVVATKLSVEMACIDQGVLSKLEQLCVVYGLPTRIPSHFGPAALLEALKTDKKWEAGTLHFILPVRIGEVMDYDRLDLRALNRVMQSLR
ncbi:3-dehydroquinate synthase [Desulfoferrobacter suflitae]|uniref:3-dehydroquinate synthase n=1 Tax=Desulfoferrobacter suflitae TaxID=2865782 RepID=UPI0021646125|nr:3-dehydroquinate synthase [Desulfoferrobacter suflitae]MCK8601029.1 3-dehydroquinate synthase [Desulfoferrobacter suflitae]